MHENSNQYAVLEVINSAGPLEASDVADRLGEQTNRVSATLSRLKAKGLVEAEGEGGVVDPYDYRLTAEGYNVVRDDDEEEFGSGLSELFDDVSEGDEGTNGKRLRQLEERLQTVEERAREPNPNEATVTLPVADVKADLDHATVISKLSTRGQVRGYLRALLDISNGDEEDMTASERRAADEESVEVVEKGTQD